MLHIKFLLILFFTSIQIYAQTDFIRGIDISKLPQIEDNGGRYSESNIRKDALQIFSDHGANLIRLRIWHSPSDNYVNLSKTLRLAKRADSLGMKFLLDFHYSDTWADPSHQTQPAAWNSLDFEELKDSVYQYSYEVLSALKKQDTTPIIIQIGNEINCGMLWSDGNVCGSRNTDAQWYKLSALLNSGINGAKDALAPEDSSKIMIHYSEGGNNSSCKYFFTKIVQNYVDYDIIGLSYYPWWHGSLDDLSRNMNDLAVRFNKEILVVETAYPWTLEWNDNTHNLVGNSGQLLAGYSATENGQADFLSDLVDTIKNVKNNRAIGFVYWAPEDISTSTLGSAWENVSLFDFNGEVLNSISIFEEEQTSVFNNENIPTRFKLFQNYPNPFNPSTVIKYTVPNVETLPLVVLKVYDLLGREIAVLVNGNQSPGNYKVQFEINSVKNKLGTGVYFYSLTINGHTKIKKMIFLR